MHVLKIFVQKPVLTSPDEEEGLEIRKNTADVPCTCPLRPYRMAVQNLQSWSSTLGHIFLREQRVQMKFMQVHIHSHCPKEHYQLRYKHDHSAQVRLALLKRGYTCIAAAACSRTKSSNVMSSGNTSSSRFSMSAGASLETWPDCSHTSSLGFLRPRCSYTFSKTSVNCVK
jgi:hypothetical protein